MHCKMLKQISLMLMSIGALISSVQATFMQWGGPASWEGLGGWQRQEYPDLSLLSTKNNITNTFSGLVKSSQPLANELNGHKYFALPFTATANSLGQCIEITTLDERQYPGGIGPDGIEEDFVLYAKNNATGTSQYLKVNDNYLGYATPEWQSFYPEDCCNQLQPAMRLWIAGNGVAPKVTIYVVPWSTYENKTRFTLNIYLMADMDTEERCSAPRPATDPIPGYQFVGFPSMPRYPFVSVKGSIMTVTP